jgi:single-strand DNA-binding protein
MGSVNKAILVGNLGRDAEFTTTAGGYSLLRFSVATTSRTKNSASNQWEDKTDWHRVVLFGRQAETLREYLRKGTLVGIDGRIQNRSWEDKDGQKRYMTEIIADRVELIGGRNTGGGGGRPGTRDDLGQSDYGDAPAEAPPANGGDDDIPF